MPAWSRLGELIEPSDNPSAQIEGLLTTGALLAIESDRHETLLQVAGSVVLALVLLWLARSYAGGVSHRLVSRGGSLSGASAGMWRAMVHELAVLRGALVPVGVLLISAAAQASIADAVLAALISAVVLLVAFELIAGLRGQLTPIEVVVQVLVSAGIGVGVLALKIILH